MGVCKMKKILLIVSLSLYLFGMGQGPALVSTEVVKKGVVNPLQEFIGSVSFSKKSKVASEIDGKVTEVFFESGSKVKKGDVLLKLDSKSLDIQIKSAKSNLNIAQINFENAKKDYDRNKDLIKQNTISQKIYDDSFFNYSKTKQAINVAKSALEDLNVQKNKKTIKSPFDGIITEKNIEVGEWAKAGTVVANLVNTQELELVFNLPSSYIYKLSKDETYKIAIKNQTINSKLFAMIPNGDKRTRTFPVKFKANVDIFVYDGMEVKIELPRAKKQEALMVSRDTVIKRFGQNVVFINNDGKAMMMPVQIIGYDGDKVAIRAKGLQAGAQVVVKGNERIFPNQPIKPLNK
jgi:RND family efflux transporter MFP subunit